MRDQPKINPHHFLLAFLIFIILFTAIDITQSNQQKLVQSTTIGKQQRILEQQEKSDKSEQAEQSAPPSTELSKNSFLMVVVIGSISFLVVGMICCIVCIIRCIIKIERARSGGFKVTNIRINYANLCPKIEYSLFLQFVGQPYQDNCVICLEEFAPAKIQNQLQPDLYLFPQQLVYSDSDQIKVEQPVEQRRQSKQTEYVENDEQNVAEQNPVKLTVCGHLLHASCLDSWLEKEENCPLCREQFTVKTLQDWEKKIGIEVLNFDASRHSSENNTSFHSNIGESSKKARQPNVHETLNSMNKSIQRNNFEIRKEIKEREMRFLTQLEKAILVMYSKIMAYHKKQEPDLYKIEHLQDLQYHSRRGEDMYFEQNAKQNSPDQKNTKYAELSHQVRLIKLKRRKKLKQQSEEAIHS